MGGYGLTPEEMHTNLQAYNHPLFRNMAYFTDLVWEINITTDTVYVMKNCLISGINKREYPYDDIMDKLKEVTHLEYKDELCKIIRRKNLGKLTKDYVFKNRILGEDKRYHLIECVITPEQKRQNHCVRLYLSMRDIQKEYDGKKMLFEQAQFRNALMKNASYSFSFDVTEGYLTEEIVDVNGRKILESMGITPPISYDEECRIYIKKNDVRFYDDLSRQFFSREGLLKLYKEGVTSDNIEYYEAAADKYMRIIPLLARDGENGHIICRYICYDITDARKEELKQKQLLREAMAETDRANAAKSEFLSSMSHDIRTPMNAIVGMTAIANTHIDDKERVADCLAKIATSSKHLLGIINEVLDMSKIEAGKVELVEKPFDLCQLVDNLLIMTKVQVTARKHKLKVSIKDIKHEKVIGDAQRIQQVFMNCMSNAIKYTPEKGKIHLTITEKESGRENIGCYVWCFEDNGIGMSEDFKEKLFTPFARAEDSRAAKVHGTGLGMAIAKNLVNMMNGNIQVESEINKGTKVTVTIYLKLQQEDDRENFKKLVDLPILVADSDKDACESTCILLSYLGLKPEGVFSGKDALEKIQRRHEKGNDYYAVIIDWDRSDVACLELVKEIRSIVGPDMPIVVASVWDLAEIEQKARAAGVNAFIGKPIFKSRLAHLFSCQLIEEYAEDTVNALGKFKELDLSDKRVLMVEDNELNAEIAGEILGVTGMKVEYATNGKEAVDRMMEVEDGYYDIIFMDVQMPVMNGYEATRAIRSLPGSYPKKVPILAMTANAFAEDVELSRSAGMNEHIAKPLDLNKLIDSIVRWTLS